HPEVAVIGVVDVQEAVVEQRPQVGEAPLTPLERVEVADQDLMVDLGADRPHGRLVQQADREHRTEPPLVLEQEAQRVGDDPPRVRPAGREAAGRKCRAPAHPPLAADVIADSLQQPLVHRARPGRGDRTGGGEGGCGGHGSFQPRTSRYQVRGTLRSGPLISPSVSGSAEASDHPANLATSSLCSSPAGATTTRLGAKAIINSVAPGAARSSTAATYAP